MAQPAKPAFRQRRVDVALTVALKYPDRDTFAERFALNLSRTGMFVRAKELAAVGSRVRFEYRLADGTRVLRGLGVVRWARAVAEAREPDEPPGMGIEFVDLDAETEAFVARIVARYGEGKHAPKRSEAAARPGKASVAPRTPREPDPGVTAVLDGNEESMLDALLGGAAPTSPVADPEPPVDTDDTELDGSGQELPAFETEPVAGAAAMPAAPVEEAAAPVDEPAVTAEEPAAPVEEPAAPVEEPAAPVEEPAAPVEEPAAPVEEPAAPVEEPAAPVEEAAAPVEEPAAPAREPAVQASREPLLDLPPLTVYERLAAQTGVVLPAADSTPPRGADLELVGDLAGTYWVGLHPSSEGSDDPRAVVIATLAGAGDDALPLPSMLSWLVTPWPAPRAKVMARRLGLEITEDDSGFPGVRWRGLLLSSAALVHDALEQLLGACAPTSRPRSGHIVLPATLNDAGRRLVLRRLAGLGVAPCRVTLSPVAIATQAAGGEGTAVLVIEITGPEARLALVEGSEVAAANTLFTAGYASADAVVAQRTAAISGARDRALLDPHLEWHRRLAAGRARRAGGDEITVQHAGVALTYPKEEIADMLGSLHEELVLAADALAERHGHSLSGITVMIAPEEPLWPGLEATFGRLFGASPHVLPADLRIRLHAVANRAK